MIVYFVLFNTNIINQVSICYENAPRQRFSVVNTRIRKTVKIGLFNHYRIKEPIII